MTEADRGAADTGDHEAAPLQRVDLAAWRSGIDWDRPRRRPARAEARYRAARGGRLAYTLELDLDTGRSTYRGLARLRFPVTGEGDLFLDFRGGTIERFAVNGQTVTPERPGHRIVLPGGLLAPTTEVEIAYQNAYDRGGDGFHHFVDPEDGAGTSLLFEPFEAHRLFLLRPARPQGTYA
jgi:aminopeptidase N